MDEPLNSLHDVPAVIEAAMRHGRLLLDESRLGPAFFDLRSGLAGELLQRAVNYRLPVAIVVPFPEAYGERFTELVHEHRTHPVVRFFTTTDDAGAWLNAQHTG